MSRHLPELIEKLRFKPEIAGRILRLCAFAPLRLREIVLLMEFY
jgi:hypothetical protein